MKSRWPQNSCQNSDQSEFIITTFEKCSSQMKKGRRQNNLGASVDMLYYILLWRDRDFNPRGKFWLRDIESSTISLLHGLWSKSFTRLWIVKKGHLLILLSRLARYSIFSKRTHKISKIIFNFFSYEYVASLESKIRRCHFCWYS